MARPSLERNDARRETPLRLFGEPDRPRAVVSGARPDPVTFAMVVIAALVSGAAGVGAAVLASSL